MRGRRRGATGVEESMDEQQQQQVISCVNHPPPPPRVKFVCSYGGRILPRPQDGQLRYVGGDTRIVAANRNIAFTDLMNSKLKKLFMGSHKPDLGGGLLLLKYRLPHEDLDSLISVTCDEDVGNMMDELDRNEAQEGAPRLHTYLFPGVRFSPGVSCFFHEPKLLSPYHNGVHMAPKSHPQPAMGVFQVPDYLFGLDPATQHPQDDDQVSSPSSKAPPKASLGESYSAGPPVAITQTDHSVHETSSPSHHHHMKNSEILWEGGITGEEHAEEKRSGVRKVNGEPTPGGLQRQGSMTRVSSKDSSFGPLIDGSHPECYVMTQRQSKLHPKQLMQSARAFHHQNHKPAEDTDFDGTAGVKDARQDDMTGSRSRFQRAGEMQRGSNQSKLGAAEMQRGAPQSKLEVVNGFGGSTERTTEERSQGGDKSSGEELHDRKVVMENLSGLTLPMNCTEGQPHELRHEQDAHEVQYRAKENMVLLHPQQQPQHADLEAVLQHLRQQQQQQEGAEQVHQLGKVHSRQVYRQARDLKEQQRPPLYEAVRSLAAPQRLVLAHNNHILSTGRAVAAAGYHHRLPSVPSMVPQVDLLASSTSAMYWHAGATPQQVPRATSPLRGNSAGNGTPPSYGTRVDQVHDNRVLRSTTNLQLGPPSYQDSSEPCSVFEQTRDQLNYPDKANVKVNNHDAALGLVHCTVKANHDSAIAGEAHHVEENVKVNPHYKRMMTVHDAPNLQAQGFRPHRHPFSLHPHR